MLTVGSICSGIGGLDLGLERAGMRVIWQSEVDPFCNRVLKRHWPHVENLGDLRDIDWSNVERPDILAGGFPCQPVSAAGKQKAQEDERWLWPQVARALRELGPAYALLENVPALLTVAGGRAAQEVFGDLAYLGFDAEWFVLSASDAGAPHLRKRIFIVANSIGNKLRHESGWSGRAGWNGEAVARHDGPAEFLADADSQRQPERPQRHGQPFEPGLEASLGDDALGRHQDVAEPDSTPRGAKGPTGEALPEPGSQQRPGRRSGSLPEDNSRAFESGLGREPHGLPAGLDGHLWPARPGEEQYDWEPPRTALGVPDRTDRLKALGNAVVPQVAEMVGRWILSGGRRASA